MYVSMYLLTGDSIFVIIKMCLPVPEDLLLLYTEAWNCDATMSKLEVVGKTFSTDMVIAAHAIA